MVLWDLDVVFNRFLLGLNVFWCVFRIDFSHAFCSGWWKNWAWDSLSQKVGQPKYESCELR